MQPIFVVTSALHPEFGVLTPQERFEQTLQTLNSIKKHAPSAKVIFVDSSPLSVDAEMVDVIKRRCLTYIELGLNNPGFSRKYYDRPPFTFLSTLKAITESYALSHALVWCKINELDKTSPRIVKISGRYVLTEAFKLSDHLSDEVRGKYLLRSAEPSWAFSDRRAHRSSLWSFCPSLLEMTLCALSRIVCAAINEGVDLEHCLYDCLERTKVTELPHMNVEGVVASRGVVRAD